MTKGFAGPAEYATEAELQRQDTVIAQLRAEVADLKAKLAMAALANEARRLGLD